MARTWAILVAAGAGERLGADRPKAFVGFGGEVLLTRSLQLLDDHAEVDRIVLVVSAGWEEAAETLVEQMVAGKVVSVIAGGATRSESVAAGLAEVGDEAEMVLVHDAARPLATAELVSRVLAALADAAGAIPAVPLADTVKRVSGDRVTATLDRSELVGVQTPQAFRFGVLREAYDRPRAELEAATDCASLVEASGAVVAWVQGERRNFKVTDPVDLALAETLL